MLYLVVGLLLLAAAVLVVIGTVTGLIDAIKRTRTRSIRGSRAGPVLLILIVAQLLHTLRFVVLRGQIVVEPSLFVGLIAVVRRILIITAELERQIPAGRALTNLLLELGLSASSLWRSPQLSTWCGGVARRRLAKPNRPRSTRRPHCRCDALGLSLSALVHSNELSAHARGHGRPQRPPTRSLGRRPPGGCSSSEGRSSARRTLRSRTSCQMWGATRWVARQRLWP